MRKFSTLASLYGFRHTDEEEQKGIAEEGNLVFTEDTLLFVFGVSFESVKLWATPSSLRDLPPKLEGEGCGYVPPGGGFSCMAG